MKISNIIFNNIEQLGIGLQGGIVPVSILSQISGETALPKTVDEVIADPSKLNDLQATWEEYVAVLGDKVIPEDAVQFAPCVKHPGKIICIGLNYRPHVAETKLDLPTDPIVFSKFANSLAASGESIPMPKNSEKIDYEAELCIVLGRRAQSVTKENALDYVFGYCNGNDVSARDLQFRSHQWLLGKTCDKFAPIGPYLVTADEIKNPNTLGIRTFVNGEKRQDSNTENMIFSCEKLIEDLSRHMTLEPGDIIMTGTPEGVILGYPEENRVWLKDGDEVTVEIDGLGRLTNRFERR
ncbi:fumarylacetoacetate hydrolase family protein [Ammoniphilus sp. 3BR4]|uniref:fumarylacetoacetate hydrolase family protein n=1 Tax=Ammoniphilus sp. 3BR4 TaxID=3158265 RepID=UPI003466AA4E